jgi:DNA-directed RNA polymerase subunit M/transcription elongation factor TFIIS
MKVCSTCGGKLVRVHRSWWQRLALKAVFECRECGAREAKRWLFFRTPTRIANCPRCGNRKLEVYKKRDRIEMFHFSVFRMLQGWMGAKLCYCALCRLQFYDFRPLAEKSSRSRSRSHAAPSQTGSA